MRSWWVVGSLFLFSCGTEPRETAIATPPSIADTAQPSPPQRAASDTDVNLVKNETPAEAPPVPPPVKRPAGIYRFLQATEDGQKVLHTIAFSPGTFRLQEEYTSKKDSIIVTEGTWAPSAGYIWLYRDQVVRGRYKWKGDILQYYSPALKEAFSMEKLAPVATSDTWQTKRGEGALLYAIGTEPFWSLEVNSKDSIVLNMPDWNIPLQAKMASADREGDSTVFTALHDSLHITVLPFFCNDGMSDFLYTKKVKLVYKGQTYTGCGEQFRTAY